MEMFVQGPEWQLDCHPRLEVLSPSLSRRMTWIKTMQICHCQLVIHCDASFQRRTIISKMCGHQTLHVMPLTSNCIQIGYGQQTFVSPTSQGWCLRWLRITAHCCIHIKACASFDRGFLNALQFVVATACVTRENWEGGSQDHILETILLHGKGSHLGLDRAFLLRQCIRSSIMDVHATPPNQVISISMKLHRKILTTTIWKVTHESVQSYPYESCS
jgi:hypothetical protein